MLKLATIPVGMLQTNSYLLWDQESRQALLFDPGAEAPKLLQRVKELGVTVAALMLTHSHVDHIAAVPELCAAWNVPIWMHRDERPLYLSPRNELLPRLPHVEGLPAPAEELPAPAGFDFQVIPTPGHTPGGVSYYFPGEKFVLTGDTLFANGVGRTDLGGDPDELRHSLEEVLFKQLPPETAVYPGHGNPTTIGDEIGNLPAWL